MRYYPLFLDLTQARCLVIGAGQVGRRKIATLLECGVDDLLVLDPFVAPSVFSANFESPHVRFEQRTFSEGDLDGKTLIFACTSSREVNKTVAAACRARNLPCNITDAPREGSFITPSCIEKAPLTVALSTGGASPALAKVMRRDLETWLGEGYVPQARFLEKLRPLLLGAGLGSENNARIFRELGTPEFRRALHLAVQTGKYEDVLHMIQAVVPPALHASLKELLNGLD